MKYSIVRKTELGDSEGTAEAKTQAQHREQTTINSEKFQQKYGKTVSDALTDDEISDILKNKEKLSNLDARKWYLSHDKRIPDLIDRKGTVEEQARRACELRSTFRTITRDLMADQEMRNILDRDEPNKTFEELVERKMAEKGLSRDEAVKDVLLTATKTRASVNQKFNLEG